MLGKLMLVATITLTLQSPAAADLDTTRQVIPNAELVGEGRLSYLLWDVYDAKLYAPDGDWRSDGPFALSLNYLMDIRSAKIADRSTLEIRNQGFQDEAALTRWNDQMRAIFPDVEKNSVLTGVKTTAGHTRFYYNSKFIGEITDPLFGTHFFAIWLSENTTEPSLRNQLLGEAIQ